MLALIFACTVAVTYADTCSDSKSIEDIDWTSKNNQIYFNGELFNMKGLSWFGFETTNYNLYGLDKHDMQWYFDWMVARGFNAIRMPFSSDYLNGGGWDSYIEAVMAAGDNGIFIMLDMHSKTAGAWTDGLYTIDQDTEIETWRTLATKLVEKGAWNIMMVDPFNEPHDVENSQWGSWLSFCEKVAEAVWGAGLKGTLIAVEGTNSNCSPVSCCWGENLTGVRDQGDTFEASKSDKLVWSPHVYYGDVTGNWVYNDAAWENHWGYLTQSTDAAIVIGEFGTKSELTWLKDLVEYLGSINQQNHFFWCLNPNSGDTGGLLQDDWTTEESAKLELLALLQPSPSGVTVSSSQVCIGEAPATTSTTTTTTTSSGGSSSGGKIRIMQNSDVNDYWMAIEFPDNDNGAITKLEMRDSGHNWWVNGDYQNWGSGAYSFEAYNNKYYGSQAFRVTVNGETKETWGVFDGLCASCTAYIDLPGSSYTEDDGESTSGLTASALAAIVICSLLCIVCIGVSVWYYKKNYYRLNKGQASFETTAADTPEPQTSADAGQDDPEIEVEMNMEDGQTATQQ